MRSVQNLHRDAYSVALHCREVRMTNCNGRHYAADTLRLHPNGSMDYVTQ